MYVIIVNTCERVPDWFLVADNDMKGCIPVSVHGVDIGTTLYQQFGCGRARESKIKR